MNIGQDVMVRPDAALPERIKKYAARIGTVIDRDVHAKDCINTIRFADGTALLLCDSDLIKLS